MPHISLVTNSIRGSSVDGHLYDHGQINNYEVGARDANTTGNSATVHSILLRFDGTSLSLSSSFSSASIPLSPAVLMR